jgi:hypothetical protein
MRCQKGLWRLLKRALSSKFTALSASFLLTLLLFAHSTNCAVQAQDQTTPSPMTLAIFSDNAAQPVPDDLWQGLVTALREEVSSDSPEMQTLVEKVVGRSTDIDPASQIQILRGDEIRPGLQTGDSITVRLIGECKLSPEQQPSLFGSSYTPGALGWVTMTNGRIEPFIYVDCKRIGQVLGGQGIGRSHEQQDKLMAIAIARVILHEWIHIATQSPHHSHHGIEKAEFSVADLVAHPAKSAVQPNMHPRNDIVNGGVGAR